MSDIDKVSDHNQDAYLPTKNENAESVTYGVVYSPDKVSNGYTFERYHITDSDYSRNDESENGTKKRRKRTSRRYSPKSTILIAFAFLLCFVFSFVTGCGSVYLANLYADTQTTEQSEYTNPTLENDRSYIDTSKPQLTETPVAPGQLMTMEDAIEAVKDSVVEITTETVKSGFGGYSQYVVSGAGSGVIISTGGYIITNNHVIGDASNIIVRLTDGSEYEAVLIGTDSKTDIAVISITPEEGREFTSAVIGTSSSLRLGQTVIAIGNPLGELGGTVTDGIISSLAREVAMEGTGNMTLLQTNAAVSPGNSGGGLFDLYGRLIGVVNAKTSGQGVEGISFAIPVDTAWDIATQLIDKGYVSGRPSLGINLKQVQYSAGIFGDIYSQVIVASDVEEYGLKTNDIIISINGYEIYDLIDVATAITSNSVGDSVVVRIKRDRKYYELKVKLREYSPDGVKQEDSNL